MASMVRLKTQWQEYNPTAVTTPAGATEAGASDTPWG